MKTHFNSVSMLMLFVIVQAASAQDLCFSNNTFGRFIKLSLSENTGAQLDCKSNSHGIIKHRNQFFSFKNPGECELAKSILLDNPPGMALVLRAKINNQEIESIFFEGHEAKCDMSWYKN